MTDCRAVVDALAQASIGPGGIEMIQVNGLVADALALQSDQEELKSQLPPRACAT